MSESEQNRPWGALATFDWLFVLQNWDAEIVHVWKTWNRSKKESKVWGTVLGIQWDNPEDGWQNENFKLTWRRLGANLQTVWSTQIQIRHESELRRFERAAAGTIGAPWLHVNYATDRFFPHRAQNRGRPPVRLYSTSSYVAVRASKGKQDNSVAKLGAASTYHYQRRNHGQLCPLAPRGSPQI